MERMKEKRLFYAAYVTAPVINSGHPKRPVTVQKIVPDIFEDRPVQASKEQVENLKRFADEQERRRKHGNA